jgi:hypothetical protein
MILNTSQRKNLAGLMAAHGFAASDFQLRADVSTRACPNYGEEYKLNETNYYFRVFLLESEYSPWEQFWLEYSPGEKQLCEYDSSSSWDTVVIEFDRYLHRLNAELATGDPWTQPGVARIVKQQQGQKLIPAGNEFIGQRLARLVFASATKALDILDPYIGPELFDRVNDADVKVPLRVLTSTKSRASALYFAAFKKTYTNAELRMLEEQKLHDRFVIVDGSTAYHIGHSIKDLGKRDTNVWRCIILNSGRSRSRFPQRSKRDL